jgi:carboxyl-terminal processing protease
LKNKIMSVNNKRIYIYLPVILSVIFALGMFAGHYLPGGKSVFIHNIPITNKLDAILGYIQEEYVDSVSKNELVELSIPAILENLDPHSVYIPAAEFHDLNDPLEGEFEGIGVEFNIQKDTIIVVNTIAGGPSERRGVIGGDRIVKINDTLVAGVKIESADVMKKLKGRKGTTVRISVKRKNTKNLIPFEITRDKIPLVSVDASFMVKDDIGYIKVSKFARTTTSEFHNAVDALKTKGIKKIIVDLRGNGGGYLDAATNLADEFLKEGSLIVYTKGRSKPKVNTFATSYGYCQDEKVVVLIDEWSASASEIFAGAIQDNDRGTIIGRRSFGKGLVQEPVSFNDGSSLRLTVARYYTPTGRCIQRSYKNGAISYYEEIADRFYNGELEFKDSIKLFDSLKFKTPGGKTVYGGGGIMPDIFVPNDTSNITNYFKDAVNLALIYRFAFDYTDENRKFLKTFSTWQQLDEYLNKIDVLKLFVVFASKNGLSENKVDIIKSKELLCAHLKAYIIRNIFDDKGFYPVALSIDKVYKTAVNYLEKN